ncbi:Phytanoyl-CoA dioxygenase [Ceratobasidium theobromae]|uniref:Phytanoyl-CoA dioxygenase n=1 Tax=Ceratobasidium theobromae TaxID=1582974 RepID=A0A5N5QHL6_9AGAM|nr:Phytanoyl-CoA dioxygenase [Ceratobasidium theobromae]
MHTILSATRSHAGVFRSGLRSFASQATSLPRIRSLTPSSSELAARKLGPTNVLRALEALNEDGIVMLENVVNEKHLDALNERMVPDAYTLQHMKDSPYNYNRGNVQQDPPPESSLFFEDVFLNPFALQVSNAALGERPKMTFCSGNTALKSTERQPVHTDADFAQPRVLFALVINCGLVEVTPENGSTELWLGTHTMANLDAQDGLHGDRASGRIKAALIEQRQKVSPPFQPVVPKGSLLLRDLRLWHAGMPNSTDKPRVMLAQIHFAPWYMNQMKLEFPRGMESMLQHPNLDMPTNFVDGPINYLGRAYGNAYDFRQVKMDKWEID